MQTLPERPSARAPTLEATTSVSRRSPSQQVRPLLSACPLAGPVAYAHRRFAPRAFKSRTLATRSAVLQVRRAQDEVRSDVLQSLARTTPGARWRTRQRDTFASVFTAERPLRLAMKGPPAQNAANRFARVAQHACLPPCTPDRLQPLLRAGVSSSATRLRSQNRSLTAGIDHLCAPFRSRTRALCSSSRRPTEVSARRSPRPRGRRDGWATPAHTSQLGHHHAPRPHPSSGVATRGTGSPPFASNPVRSHRPRVPVRASRAPLPPRATDFSASPEHRLRYARHYATHTHSIMFFCSQ